MFSQKKGHVDINKDEPTFFVKYAGKTETFQASGKGCTHNAVQRIMDNSVEERHMRRMSIVISEAGMTIVDLDAQKREPHKVDIKDISYCCAEKGVHDHIFAWIAKDKVQRKLFCHAVLCHNADKARMMAIILSKSFQVAYRDWKMRREKEARLKTNAQQLTHTATNTDRLRNTNTSTNTDGGNPAKETSNMQTSTDTVSFQNLQAANTHSTTTDSRGTTRPDTTYNSRTGNNTHTATKMDSFRGVEATFKPYTAANTDTTITSHTTYNTHAATNKDTTVTPDTTYNSHTYTNKNLTVNPFSGYNTHGITNKDTTMNPDTAYSTHTTTNRYNAVSPDTTYNTHTTTKIVGFHSIQTSNKSLTSNSKDNTNNTNASTNTNTTYNAHTSTNTDTTHNAHSSTNTDTTHNKENSFRRGRMLVGASHSLEDVLEETDSLVHAAPAFDYADQAGFGLDDTEHVTFNYADQAGRSTGDNQDSHSYSSALERTDSNSSGGSNALYGQGSDSEGSVAFSNAMSQMNFVEDHEICFSDNAIVVE